MAASIALENDLNGMTSAKISVGEKVTVRLKLSAKDVKMTGISLFISYNSNLLEVEDAMPSVAGIQPVKTTDLTQWTLFSNAIQPGENGDPISIIDFSMATIHKNKSFTGEGILGTITLVAIRPGGETALQIETDESRHIDSRFTFESNDGSLKTVPLIAGNRFSISLGGLLLKQIGNLTLTNDGKIYTITLTDFMIEPANPFPGLSWEASPTEHLNVVLVQDKHAAQVSGKGTWTGTEEVTFTAIDSLGGRSSTTARITVKSPPRLTDIPDLTFIVGQNTSIDLNQYVMDYDDTKASLKWDFIGSQNVVVSLTPDNKAYFSSNGGWSGQETITFRVKDDDGYSASDTITVTILPDTFPRVLDIPDVIAKSDGSYMSVRIDLDDYVSDSDTPLDKIIWSYSGNTYVNVSINPTTNEVVFSSIGGWVGKEKITFRATDPDGNSAEDSCYVEIVPDSLPPAISKMPDLSFSTVVGKTQLDLNKYVSDMDTPIDKIRWSFRGNSVITVEITPENIAFFTAKQAASEKITFTATDPDGNSAEKSITVICYEPKPPTISNIPTQVLKQGELKVLFDLDEYVSDDQTPVANIQWVAQDYDPQHLVITIDADHLVTVSASSNWFGTETVKFLATDQDGNTASKNVTIKVSASPVIEPIPQLTINVGDTNVSIDLDDYVDDPDTPSKDITWTTSGYRNLIVVIDSNTHKVMIHAPDGSQGSESVLFTATDPDGNQAEILLSVIVKEKDNGRPPVLTGFDQLKIAKGGSKVINLDEHVTDPDSQPEEIKWEIKGATNLKVDLNEFDRTVTISAVDPEWTGTEPLTFIATDGQGNKAQAQLNVNVFDESQSASPRISTMPEQKIKPGDTVTVHLTDYISDEDSQFDELQISVTGNQKLSVSLTDGVLSISAPDDWEGIEDLRIDVSDPEDNTASGILKVNVNKNNGSNSGSDQTPPEIILFATPNPGNPRIQNITVISSEALLSAPTVTALMSDETVVRIDSSSDRIWSGMIIIPRGIQRNVTVEALAVDLAGNRAIAEIEIDIAEIEQQEKAGNIAGDSDLSMLINTALITESATITVTVPRASGDRFRLVIYSIYGDIVAQYSGTDFTGGESGQTLEWKAQNAVGERVSNGIYFISLESGVGRIVKKVLVKR